MSDRPITNDVYVPTCGRPFMTPELFAEIMQRHNELTDVWNKIKKECREAGLVNHELGVVLDVLVRNGAEIKIAGFNVRGMVSFPA